MRIVYASSSKEDAENFAKNLELQAKSIGKEVKTEVKKEGDRYMVYSNGKLITKLDVVYVEGDGK